MVLRTLYLTEFIKGTDENPDLWFIVMGDKPRRPQLTSSLFNISTFKRRISHPPESAPSDGTADRSHLSGASDDVTVKKAGSTEKHFLRSLESLKEGHRRLPIRRHSALQSSTYLNEQQFKDVENESIKSRGGLDKNIY